MGRLNLRAELTRRETQIAELLAWGAAKKEVADLLRISPRTVENTARHIYEKIGIQKATELCVYWFCAKCGVSPSKDPLKRAFIALALLFILLPSELQPRRDDQTAMRPARTTRVVTRTIRGRRSEDNLFNPLDF
ncbi:MAG: helix-turn-helix transcriptional regulator [Muribaculaceae bacterium]|nr:helix-turn-helix transcriptional regulator [Muribaculaceae bacterium]MBO5187444.1 helix-turn-helix transcriptional regulator [Prevotella sp.]